MYDIEKELRELKPKNHTPTDAFRHQTLAMLRNKTKKRRSSRKLVFSLSAAVVMGIALLVVMLPMFNSVSYYTLDINPSIQFTVNSNDTVTDVSSANDDAVTLLDGSKLKGMPIKEALQSVIQLAYTQEYLAPGGHVLVAHFGSDEGISDLELKDIVDDITPGINVLLLNGEKSSYKEAQKQDMQAGIYLLKEQATDIGIAETDVDSLITLMCSEKDDKATEGKGKGNSGMKDNASGSVADVDNEAEHVSNSEAAHSKNEDKEDKPDKDDKQDKQDKPGKDDKQDKEDKPDKDDKEDKEDKPDNSNNGNGKNNFNDSDNEDDDGDFDEDDDFEDEDDDGDFDEDDEDDDDKDKDYDDVDDEEDNDEEDNDEEDD